MSILSTLWIILPTFIIAWCVKYILEYQNKRKKINQLAGLPDLPFVGNAHQLKSNPAEFLRQLHDWCNEYRAAGHKVMRFWVGTEPYVCVIHAEGAEAILHATRHLAKNQVYDYLHEWLGLGLLTSAGTKWKSRRRLLTPSFHFNVLNDFMTIFNEQARILVDKVSATCPKTDDVFCLITRCTLDIICETAMGVKMETQSLKNVNYIDAIHDLSNVIQTRQKMPWLISDLLHPLLPASRREAKALKLLKKFTRKVIEDRREELIGDHGDGNYSEGKRRSAFLTSLLRTQTEDGGLSNDDVQEEVDTFMFEGHDTTASGITWTIQLIGEHPHVLKKLLIEIDEVFGDSDRDVTDDDIKKLVYLNCVLKEALRLCPPVPFVGRVLSEEEEIGGVTLDKGTAVVVMIYFLHRDPEAFPDPEKFDPDRFLPENVQGRHPFAYVPFSAGPRNCIGQKFALMEEKVVLSWLLRRFTWKSVYNYDQLQATAELVLRPSIPVSIEVNRRD